MAAVVAAFLAPVIKLLGDNIHAPIKRQFNYLCCFNTNVENFRREAKTLCDAKADLEMRVAVQENNSQVIHQSVNTWLTKSIEMQVQVGETETDISSVPSGCLAIKSRFLLSKKVVKMSKEIQGLQQGCKFDTISVPPPPASMQPTPAVIDRNFHSRKQIEEDVMNALRARNVCMMGICGMGGIGKTTLAKKVMHTSREENLFDEIFMVVVGEDMDRLNVQLQIAQSLGLSLEEEALHVRAQKLHSRLSRNEKVLIVVDDIWDAVTLEELGIPCECTVLLTSRSMEVLNQMDVKVFALPILDEEEAWSLFSDVAGISVDNQVLASIAKQVVKECKGLPLAIQILGSASKRQISEHYWKDTLRLLQNSSLEHVPNFLKGVYPCLKRSFDEQDNHAKNLLLLCSQFPEDADIPLKELTMYCMSLRLFGETSNLENTRNRLFTVIDTLKNRSLLMDAENVKYYVRMHDIVRDVAIVIAREKGLVNSNLWSSVSQCKWNFLFLDPYDVRHDHFMRSSYSKLALLSICSKRPWRRALIIRSLPSFSEMKELTSMTLKDVSFEFPDTIKFLENLRMLYLVRCNLKSISMVGELSGLEFLVCDSCNEIEEVPVEIRGLKHLKKLCIESCYRLTRIAPCVISNLTELEELKIRSSFSGWESTKVREEVRNNPTLKELEALTKLKSLCIEIKDLRLVVEDIHLPSSIVNFGIQFFSSESYRMEEFGKAVSLTGLEQENHCADWIHQLVRTTECLHLDGNGSSNFDLSQVHKNITTMRIENCESIEALVHTATMASVDWKTSCGFFPTLKWLWLKNLPNLRDIFTGPGKFSTQNVSLVNLEMIELNNCGKLQNLFSVKGVENMFLQLKSLNIIECKMMESVLYCEENEQGGVHSRRIKFPKLKELVLRKLSSLTTFGKGIEHIEFPLLNRLEIVDCANFKRFVSSFSSGSISGVNRDDENFPELFNNQMVAFGRLKELCTSMLKISSILCSEITVGLFSELECLEVEKCSDEKLFYRSIVNDISSKIKYLSFRNCPRVKSLFGANEHEILSNVGLNGNLSRMTFSNLKTLRLHKMISLTTFCDEYKVIDFPVLETLHIFNCSNFASTCKKGNAVLGKENYHLFCWEKVTFGGLKRLGIIGYNNDNIWCHQIPPSFFKQLKILYICEFDEVTVLFSSPITAYLVNLKILNVSECKKMERVISNDGVEVSTNKCVLLPSLKGLHLEDLPFLGAFCEWSCALELTSLTEIVINNCPRMASFTLGSSVSTPKLEEMKLNGKYSTGKEVDENGGLNVVLHRQCMESTNHRPLNAQKWII